MCLFKLFFKLFNSSHKPKMANNEVQQPEQKVANSEQSPVTPDEGAGNPPTNVKEQGTSAPETPPAELVPYDKIFRVLQNLQQESEQIKQQLNAVVESNKTLLTQFHNSILKQQKELIGAELQKLEQPLATLTQNNGLAVERMRTISEDNKKYNLEMVEAFKAQQQLVKDVWEDHVFPTEERINNILTELESGVTDEMFGKLKKASRDSTKGLKNVLAKHNVVAYQDPDGTPIDVKKHRVIDRKEADDAKQDGTIAETLRSGVQYIDGKILIRQWICGYIYPQQTETISKTATAQPETESTSTSNT
jgi:hypothetical protein